MDLIDKGLDMQRLGVEAGDVEEILAARVFKAFFDLFVDFLKRLNAIGGKRRGTDGDAFVPGFGLTRDLFHSIGLKPVFGTEFRLKRCHDLRVIPAEAFLKQASRFSTLTMIGIAPSFR